MAGFNFAGKSFKVGDKNTYGGNKLDTSNNVTMIESKLLMNRILKGEDVRKIIAESAGCMLIKEDDQEYWDYVHNYGSEEEREKAADYFDVSPSAFDETYAQFYELEESSLKEGKKFVKGEKFTFTDKYGTQHECTVLDKKLFDEVDYDDYAIGTITISYPTLGKPHVETLRLYKEDFGDEYFVSGVSSAGGKSNFGIRHIVKP